VKPLQIKTDNEENLYVFTLRCL